MINATSPASHSVHRRFVLVILSIAFFSYISYAQSWNQLGADIVGGTDDGLGETIAMSSDGSIVAIGAASANGLQGHVNVYEYNGSSWTQLGATLSGSQAGDSFGSSVSLSADGTVLAIGARTADGAFGASSVSGYVNVYVYDAVNGWQPQGSTINAQAAQENFGQSLSLSVDGNVLGIGAAGAAGGGSLRGTTRIYEWNSTAWVQVGTDINGDTDFENSGTSVSLVVASADTVIAIGSPFYTTGFENEGRVRIYTLNMGSWGTPEILVGDAYDNMGTSLSFSDDGARLAVGSPHDEFFSPGPFIGNVEVYALSTSWTRLGSAISSSIESDTYGKVLSLSGDGSHVIIGAPGHVPTTNPGGRVEIWTYGTDWTQVGSTISESTEFSTFGGSVAISSDGSIAASGSPITDGSNSNGYARVYEFGTIDMTPPVISGSATVNVVENNTAVSSYTADEPITTWALTGTDAALFDISSGGVVTFLAAPDAETPGDAGGDNNYDITIQGTDGNNNTGELVVVVTVTDQNDNAPVISAESFSVSENAGLATPVGTLSATDQDITSTTFSSWTITSGNELGLFSLDAANGTIRTSISDIDREAVGEVNLTVTVSDGTNTSAGQQITITINDVNDVNPVIDAALNFDLSEDAAVGAVVGTATATDGDATATTFSSWTITAGNDDGIFAIDASLGQLSVADNATLDFETTTSYILEMTVSDGINTSAPGSITINVTDANDPPTFTSTPLEAVNEGGFYSYTVQTTDQDGDAVSLEATVKPDWLTLNDPTVSTFAGSGVDGAADGTGTAASFAGIRGMAFDSNGNLFVIDNSTLRKITPTGEVITLENSDPGVIDHGQSNGLAIDNAGNYFTINAGLDNWLTGVINDNSYTVLEGTGLFVQGGDVGLDADELIYSAAGNGLTRWSFTGGSVSPDESITIGDNFNSLLFLTVDESKNVYVSSWTTHSIYKVTPQNEVSVLAGTGSAGYQDGAGAAAAFDTPGDLVVDKNGNVYVYDSGNKRIRKITQDGVVSTFAGNGNDAAVDGSVDQASFSSVSYMAIDGNGNIFLAEGGNTIRKINTSQALEGTASVPPAEYAVTLTATDGNGGSATQNFSIEVLDNTPPTVTSDNLVTNDATPELTGTIDDNEATIEVTVAGQTYPATNNEDGTWTLADNTITTELEDGSYDVAVTATDIGGNVGMDQTTNELTIDATAPTARLAEESEEDFTRPVNGEFTAVIVFSEEVTDFTFAEDVQFENVTSNTLNGSFGVLHQVTVVPNGAGNVIITIPEGAVSDAAGNTIAATTFEVVFDNAVPTVSIEAPTTTVDGFESFSITVTFSEAVTAFDNPSEDLTITNGTASNLQSSGTSGSIYTVDIALNSGVMDQGNIAIMIPSNVAADAVGNANEESETVSVAYDLPYAGGSGTAEDPYLIGDKVGLKFLSENTSEVSYHFIQTNDIALESADFETGGILYYDENSDGVPDGFKPIGGQEQFSGTYDGLHNGIRHTISGVYSNGDGYGFAGMFFYIGGTGIVKNLGLENVDFTSGRGYTVGALAAFSDGTISNCYSTGAVTTEEDGVEGGTAGGLIGENYGSISTSYSTCEIIEKNRESVFVATYLGGLVGRNYSTISDSYATGNVSGSNVAYIGGLVGRNAGPVTNCYATGFLSENGIIGGLVGDEDIDIETGERIIEVMNSFWNVETSGTEMGSPYGNHDGLVGLTTAQMQDQTSFTEWDFADVWQMDNGCVNNGYPLLAWQSNPQLPVLTVETTDYTFSDPAAVSLEAMVSDGAVARWYADETSTEILFEGNNYIPSPPLSFDCYVFWVAAETSSGDCTIERQAINVKVQYSYSGGTGTEEDPFQISTKDDLKFLTESSCDWSIGVTVDPETAEVTINQLHFKQVNNISFTPNDFEDGGEFFNNGEGFRPIALDSKFQNVYDGGGFTIDGLQIDRPETDNIGLFSNSDLVGVLKNIRITNSTINGGSTVGGIAGVAAHISHCSVENTSITGKDNVAGLLGEATLRGDLNTSEVLAPSVENSSAINIDISSNGSGGGILGTTASAVLISDCYVTGSITTDATMLSNGIGGISGDPGITTDITISNCHVSATLSHPDMSKIAPIILGGNFGTSGTRDVLNSFWNSDVTGIAESLEGTALTTSEMQTLKTFIDAGWDFTGETVNGEENHWQMDSDDATGFPILSWQKELDPLMFIEGSVTDENDAVFTAGNVRAFDSEGNETATTIDTEGAYYVEMTSGEYFVKVTPDDQDAYRNTFLGDVALVSESSKVSANAKEQHIKVIAKSSENLLTGNSTVSGNVVEGDNSGRVVTGRLLSGTPLVGVSVFLIRTSDGQIMTEAITDENGEYAINGIPAGEYQLRVEIAGVQQDLSNATITFDEEATELIASAIVSEDGTVSLTIEEVLGVEDEIEIQVYPNPVTDFLNVRVDGTATLRVLNLSGQAVKEASFTHETQLDVRGLTKGVHFIEITSDKGRSLRKLVKR